MISSMFQNVRRSIWVWICNMLFEADSAVVCRPERQVYRHSQIATRPETCPACSFDLRHRKLREMYTMYRNVLH